MTTKFNRVTLTSDDTLGSRTSFFIPAGIVVKCWKGSLIGGNLAEIKERKTDKSVTFSMLEYRQHNKSWILFELPQNPMGYNYISVPIDSVKAEEPQL